MSEAAARGWRRRHAHSLAECSISGRRRCGARDCWHSTNTHAARDSFSLSLVSRWSWARNRPCRRDLCRCTQPPGVFCVGSLLIALALFACAMQQNWLCDAHKVAGRFMHFRFHSFRRKIKDAFYCCLSYEERSKVTKAPEALFWTFLWRDVNFYAGFIKWYICMLVGQGNRLEI